MRSKIGVVLLAGVLALLIASPASAQTVTGQLSGHVMDKSGAVMPNVTVKAANEQTGAVREAKSNESGYYLIDFLSIGRYTVTATAQGFNSAEKKGVVVELNKNTVSDFSLEPGAVTTVVEVRGGEIPLIETTTGSLKHTLDTQTIEATPLPGRNFMSLVEQIPGFQLGALNSAANNPTNSTGSYAVFNGQGSRSATFQVDGVNNDDSSENQNRQNVNISSIKEFQVLTNAYSAEFGRAGGAVILVQTKSGTNAFHGDAYDFIQNDIFNANDFFANQRTPKPSLSPVRRNQYGGTVGGPVFKDRLFLFGSGERVSNVAKGSMSRFIWLPSDGPRACNAGEVPAPGGPYCVDPASHPNLQRDLAFMQSVMDLWKTPQLQGKTPNDPAACSQVIQSGRPNRCVVVSGLGLTYPDSDYSGRTDWNAGTNTTMNARYQYSRQIRQSPRIILGDNYGTVNNRQYSIGYTFTHVWSPTQTGEFRYGFGNRATLQDVTDGNTIPTIRFGTTLVDPSLSSDLLAFGGTVIGTSINVPINRRQRDHQFVYNHTKVFTRHTMRMGIDQRFQALDDLASNAQRGYWTFGTEGTTTGVLNRTNFAGWENFLRGYFTGFQIGYGPPLGELRYGETNLYAQDDWRVRRNLTLNLGFRWEGVRAPEEVNNRFSYGYEGDFDNIEPRFGFAWTPESSNSFLSKFTGGRGNFVIRGGYGIYHSRIFQSIFSQSGLNFRFQPPNGFTYSFSASNPCATNPTGGNYEVSDPTCGFVFTPGAASRSVAPTCSSSANGCGPTGQGVKIQGGQLLTSLLIPDKNLQLPYVQQWNLTLERKLRWNMAVELAYNGNRGIGLPFYSGINDAQFPIASPLVSVDIGGGNFQPVVFDRACLDSSDPVCTNGPLTTFFALSSTTATLAQKGIVVQSGVPHGYIAAGNAASYRVSERRPDRTNGRNVALNNFAWTYYNAMVLKVKKVVSHGLAFTGSWTLSKGIDTGSEATYTGTDVNAPVGVKNPAASLRALSSYDQRHRVVLSYSYTLPWMRNQEGPLGRIIGGWTWSGVTTFTSGNPFTVLAGYDVNMDGVGGDRPRLASYALNYLYNSIDGGRATATCLSPLVGGRCLDTYSQLQLPGSVFLPPQGATASQFILTPGQDQPGSIGRNTFFEQGMKNFDMALSKSVHVAERFNLELRMELYNAFNRVPFNIPARTVNSTTPMGRITSTINIQNYVNSARNTGARMGQLAIRLTF